MIDRKSTQALTAASVLLSLACSPRAYAEDYEVAEVIRGPIQVQATTQGRYSADALGDVMYEAKRYNGELKVAEVLVTHGNVTAGQAIIKLEAPDMDEQLADATEALSKAKLKFDWAKQEHAIAKAERDIAAERRKLSLADTLSAHERWDAFGKKDAYKQAELQIQRSEDRFADEAQELKQLEELYDGAKLASRTQDVVLGRARRSLAASKQYIEISRRNHKVQMEVTLPNQERDMDNALSWMKAEHENAAWRAEVAKIQQDWALDAARESFENSKEALAELEADKAALTVKADQAGVMTAIGLKPGDKASANQALAKLLAADKGTLKASLSTKDLRIVQEGGTVDVTWDWFSEHATYGKIGQIAWQGAAGGANDAKYEATIDIESVNAVIRPGMTASIKATKQLPEDTLSIPNDAVVSDDSGSYCMLKVGDAFERRAVSVGASNNERVQIVKGLSAGEFVRVPAK